MSIHREFSLCVLGSEGVGKTSLCSRLCGVPFSRKSGYKPSVEEDSTRWSFEVVSSQGLLLYHLHDWGWTQMRRQGSINQQLMRGSDGAVFVYDVTDRRSKSDFDDFLDWYQRASGFDKPWLIVSNKNDQKKKAVQEAEGMSLANKADRRAYCAVSLVDDTGLDTFVLSLSKIMLGDLNLTVQGISSPASESSLRWSEEQFSLRTANIGLSIVPSKTIRVILVCMNSSVGEKFSEAFLSSKFLLEVVMSPAECDEIVNEGTKSEAETSVASLPVGAILAPPTASKNQQLALTEIAGRKSIPFVISIPRSAVSQVEESLETQRA